MERIGFDESWIFWNENNPEKKITIMLPHDAMRTEKRLKGIANGFCTGFYPGGKYVYLKEFYGEERYSNKSVVLEFEGIYQKSQIFLNGELVGGHVYGYTDFFVDITDKIKSGQKNIVEVHVDNSQTPNARWYTGSGIYRDVWMWIGEKSHIVPNGIKVVTKREEDYAKAYITTEISQMPDGGVVNVEIIDGNEMICSGTGVESVIPLDGIQLWSEENPKLYTVKVSLSQDDLLIDSFSFATGFRILEWSADKGICINGKQVLLRGGCIHHDHGILGAANYRGTVYRKVKKMKDLGFNAIRFAHNPSDKSILEICDELGMYFMDETFDMWQMKKAPYDYGLYFDKHWNEDVTAMVRKDWSHPCVILYSIGNEVADIGQASGVKLTKMLVDRFHELDESRPTVNAINPVVVAMGSFNKEEVSEDDIVDPYKEDKNSAVTGSLLANTVASVAPFIKKMMGKPDKVEKKLKPSMEPLDIVGYNYAENCYLPHHEWNPNRIMVGSETYPGDVFKNWELVKNNAFVVGDFVWTAWDYLGEVGLGSPIYGKRRGGFNRPWPCIHSACGYIDITGKQDAQGYYAAAVWGTNTKPYIGVRPVNHSGEKYYLGAWRHTDAIDSWSWSGMEGKSAEIVIYAVGYEAELFVNKVSQGRKTLHQNKAEYSVRYQPGTVEAISYDVDGKIIGRTELLSAEGDTKLSLLPEKEKVPAIKGDIVYINISLTGTNDEIKVLAKEDVFVEVQGPAELIGLGSSDPFPLIPYIDDHCETFHGRAQAIVRLTGEVGEIRVNGKTQTGLLGNCSIWSE